MRFDVKLLSAELHYHGCPTCYEKRSCMMDCSIEPDLCEGKNKEILFGAYVVCEHCKAFYRRCELCSGQGPEHFEPEEVEILQLPQIYLLDGSLFTLCPKCDSSGAQFDGGYDEDGEYKK